MAKVITFSRVFPAYHTKKGERTNFVEQFWNSFNYQLGNSDELIYSKDLFDLWELNPKLKHGFELTDFIKTIKSQVSFENKKYHTIRAGKRYKKGDFFSPRVWSGKPYKSKQIIIDVDTEIKNVWDIEIYHSYEIYIEGVYHCSLGSERWNELCKNDALNSEDMQQWFNKLPFKGQIICWNDSINYNI